MSESRNAEVTDWFSPGDRLPPDGVIVEIAVLPDMSHIDRAKRLGRKWVVQREHGGPYYLFQPAEPAFWRLVVGGRSTPSPVEGETP